MKPWTWMALLIATSGCVGTDVGNPPDDDQRRSLLEFATVDSDVTEASALSTSVGPVDVAWLSVEAVRVQSDCDADPTRIDGPFYVDLISGDVLPEPVELEGNMDEICGLTLDLGPAGDDAPTELVGLTALVLGENTDGPVVIESSTERVLPYNGQGFIVGEHERFIDAFDARNWFGTDSMGPGGVENAFFSALQHDSRIVPDANGDGKVSRDEFVMPVAVPRP